MEKQFVQIEIIEKRYTENDAICQEVHKGQAGETKQYSIEAIFSFCGDMGYTSANHQKTGEQLGKESSATYYHRFNENSPFFLDYTFSNMPTKSYSLCEWNKEMSNHVAQIIEV